MFLELEFSIPLSNRNFGSVNGHHIVISTLIAMSALFFRKILKAVNCSKKVSAGLKAPPKPNVSLKII